MFRKITVISSLFLVLLSMAFGVGQSFAQDSLADFDSVDTYISTRMKDLGIPGAALVIVQGDQIVHLKAFGVADAEDARSHHRRHSSPVRPANHLPHLPLCNWLKQ